MIRNYIKIALRNLSKNRIYSVINISGLAVGVACCTLIVLFVKSEFSYDRFHSRHERIYRVWQHEKYQGEDFPSAVTPLPLASALRRSYPEVESVCRVYGFTPQVKIGGSLFNEDIRMVDSTFFHMFDFELVNGDRKRPFPTANSVILTTRLAKKYFGDANPVGSTIEIQLSKDKMSFVVAGVVAPAPEESSIKYNMLISYANSKHIFSKNAHASWYNVYNETYALLRPGTSAAALEAKLPAMMKEQLGKDKREDAFVLHLQPMADIHLDTKIPVGNEPIGDPKYIYILSGIGILILLVACINFITLSIGRSTGRALEVGVRKTLGAEKAQLIKQFWSESLVLSLIAVAAGAGLAAVSLHAFNGLIGRKLVLSFDGTFVAIMASLTLAIGLIAGIYPAIVLSGFSPVEALKGRLRLRSNRGWLQHGLIVGQFTVSVAMVIGTIIITRQLNFLKSKDLGYSSEQVIVVSTNKIIGEGDRLAAIYTAELKKHPEVSDASTSIYSMAETPWVNLGITDGQKVYHGFRYNTVDAGFLSLMKVRLKAGRNFSKDDPSDRMSAAIVNEAFVREFHISDPVGKKLPGEFEQVIIGVTEDFNYESLHTKVEPLLLTMSIDSIPNRTESITFSIDPKPRISVRFKGGSIQRNLDVLKDTWKKAAPGQEFDYKFLDETLAAQYKMEEKTSAIIKLASGLAIFIACMGLFGLATLTVSRRTREIGIRKVLGASLVNINGLLAKDFVKLIALSIIIASPLAWWGLNQWLNNFAYRTDIPVWSFIVAGCAVLIVALITIGLQTSRAAAANPVKSLRTE